MVRVELFRAEGEEYESLHERMKHLGLKRTVKFDDGLDYKLPIGTYFGSSNESIINFREKISTAADPLSSGRAAVIVCDSNNWSGYLFKA